MWTWIKARATEKTTWAAVGVMLGFLGVPAANDIAANLGTIAGSVAVLAGVLVKE